MLVRQFDGAEMILRLALVMSAVGIIMTLVGLLVLVLSVVVNPVK